MLIRSSWCWSFSSPRFSEANGLDYLDSLYNSISKGSAYYIPKFKEEAKAFNGTPSI